jgi:hypothetical protein
VPRRQVERVEVVPGRLHLASVDDLVAETEEHVLDLAANLGDRMEVAPRKRLTRQRDVEILLGPVAGRRALELLASQQDRRLDPVPELVQRLAGLAVSNLAQC